MMTKPIRQTRSGAWAVMALAIIMPQLVLAQETEDEERNIRYGGTLYLDALYMQNASRTPVEENQVDEPQTRYGTNLFGSVNTDQIELSADYDFYQNDYYEDTQRDRFIRTGRSELVLGTENTFYQLDVAHSTQRFLTDPTGPSTLENTDQRDIVSVSPLLRLRPGANNISVAGHYSNIVYKETDINDSERVGFGIDWNRRISPLYSIGLGYLENEIDYELGDTGDYTYRRAAFTFASNLRLVSYRLEIGANEAEPLEGEAVDGVYYDFELLYGRPSNTWSLTAQRSITDTSLGNANNPFFSEGITSDVSRNIQDRLERRSVGANWRSDFLCYRCDLSLRAGYEDERYFTTSSENRSEHFVGSILRYRLRPSVSLNFSLEYTFRDFEDGGLSRDYNVVDAMVAVEFDPFLRYFHTQVWYEHERRIPVSGSQYYTNAVGITLAYDF